jgi:hypothetical protein
MAIDGSGPRCVIIASLAWTTVVATMLHPVGKLPPAVYWRRRLVFVLLPAVLLLLLIVYVMSGDGDSPARPAAGSTTRSGSAPSTPASTPPARTSTPVGPGGTASSSPVKSTTPAAVAACTPANLKIQAATGKPSYPVASRPDFYIIVTNTAATACRQDLADKQIVWTIMAGDARVWGSHDCAVEPGTDLVTLAPRVAVKRAVIWSGQTSAPSCAGTRLVAQAGTYNLTAALAGRAGPAVQFSLTG